MPQNLLLLAHQTSQAAQMQACVRHTCPRRLYHSQTLSRYRSCLPSSLHLINVHTLHDGNLGEAYSRWRGSQTTMAACTSQMWCDNFTPKWCTDLLTGCRLLPRPWSCPKGCVACSITTPSCLRAIWTGQSYRWCAGHASASGNSTNSTYLAQKSSQTLQKAASAKCK